MKRTENGGVPLGGGHAGMTPEPAARRPDRQVKDASRTVVHLAERQRPGRRRPSHGVDQKWLALVRNRAGHVRGGDPRPAALGWHLQSAEVALAPMLRLCLRVLAQVAPVATRRWRPSPALRALLTEYQSVRHPPLRARRPPSGR